MRTQSKPQERTDAVLSCISLLPDPPLLPSSSLSCPPLLCTSLLMLLFFFMSSSPPYFLPVISLTCLVTSSLLFSLNPSVSEVLMEGNSTCFLKRQRIFFILYSHIMCWTSCDWDLYCLKFVTVLPTVYAPVLLCILRFLVFK